MKSVNIIIDDENRYFAEGLRLSIQEYAQHNNKTVCFLTPGDAERPDVVFASSRRRRIDFGRSAPVITIKDTATRGRARVLCRKDEYSQLVTLLAEVLSASAGSALFERKTLTRRERQVVGYLRSGLDQSQTARLLGLSVKTIHSHKRSVMSKLMLNRHHDFIYWMLSQEGEYS